MRKADLLVQNNSAWNKKSTNPSTMASGQEHIHPAAVQHFPRSERVTSASDLLQHNPQAIARETKSESLQPADARTDRGFWERTLAHCRRMLGMNE